MQFTNPQTGEGQTILTNQEEINQTLLLMSL